MNEFARIKLTEGADVNQATRFLVNILNIPIRNFIIPLPDGKTPYIQRFILDEGDKSKSKKDRTMVFLHIIYESDGDRDPHDHPWDFKSQIIHGVYNESQYTLGCLSPVHSGTVKAGPKVYCAACGEPAIKPIESRVITFGPGDVNEKKAAELHRLQIIKGPVVTLVTRGPQVREWGFQTDEGWVHHAPYLKAKFPNADIVEVE